jgi:hypothetical protein
MNRIEINVQTGEQQVIELTAEEIAAAEAQYQKWLVQEEARKAALPAQIQSQIDALQAQLNSLGA